MRTLLASLVLTIGCGSNAAGMIDALGTGDDAPSQVDAPAPHVALTLLHHPMTPATFEFVVAYQDGSGPWTLAPAPMGDVYDLPIASGRYGYMWSCKSANARVVNLGYFTIAEHAAITDTIPPRCTDAPTVAITGNVSNRPATGRLVAQFGTASGNVEPGSGNFRIDTFPGTEDLVIVHTAVAAGTSTDTIVDQVALSRALVATAPVTKTIDFATAAAVQSFPATIIATTQQRGAATTTLFASGGTSAGLVRDTAAPFEVEALAVAQATTSDVYETTMTLAGQGQSVTTTLVTGAPADQTFTAPAGLGGALTAIAAGLISTTWVAYANAVGYRWEASQALTAAQCGPAACAVAWTALISTGYAGSSPMFAMPDLSQLAGFSADFAFVAGTVVNGDTQGITSTAGLVDFPPLAPAAAGTQRTNARSDWSVTPM